MLFLTPAPRSDVIPAKAGIQYSSEAGGYWVPASAGTTTERAAGREGISHDPVEIPAKSGIWLTTTANENQIPTFVEISEEAGRGEKSCC